MKHLLFRKQAVEHSVNRLRGEVLLLPRTRHFVILVFLVLWVLAVGVWLVGNTYTRKATVTGWLEQSEGVVRVYSDGVGLVNKVLVHEGDSVSMGQPLVVLDRDQSLADGDDLEAVILQEYETQKRLLSRQLDRSVIVQEMRIENLEKSIESSERDLALLDRQLESIDARYDLYDRRKDNFRALLSEGHSSRAELESVQETLLALDSDRQAIYRNKESQVSAINLSKSEQVLIREEAKNLSDQLSAQLSTINQNILQLSARREFIVKASRDGIASNVQANMGQRATSTTPLMSILPLNDTLTARLIVPVVSAGFIKPGQVVELRYDAFPYQKFGLYRGVVESISPSILLPGEIPDSPIPIQSAVYKVNVSLADSFISAYGEQHNLKSGMTLSADIKLDDRTLLQWLFDPVYSIKGKL